MIRRLAHLCLVTDDLPRMTEFYSKVLGFPIKFTFTNSDGEVFGHYFECGDSSFIEIFDRKLKLKQWGGELEPLHRGGNCNHFCWEVTGLAEFRALLQNRGLSMSEIKSGMDQSLQTWTSDPDGNAIELMEYTARSWQLCPPAKQA